MIDIPTD